MPYYFNLPLITELTPDQQWAVDEPNPFALSGGPGTGKSVVSLWRHIRNHRTGLRNSLLLTYTKTLEHYLRASAVTQDVNAGNHIGRTQWWLINNPTNYDEIIIDEGQDIKKENFIQYFRYTNRISYGADKEQIMYLTQEEWSELKDWFDTENRLEDNRIHGTIELQRNFRNSKEILLFARSVFPNVLIRQNTINESNTTGLKPIMKLNVGWDVEGQVDEIIDIINDFQSDTHNIAVLVPFQSMVTAYYNAIKERLPDIIITHYRSDNENFNGLSAIHITTFKSSKGTEFDTVIIPEFDKYNWILENQDKIGGRVNEKDYYVALTRTKSNLFLLCKGNYPDIGDIDTVTIE